jgi:hypothetical protein
MNKIFNDKKLFCFQQDFIAKIRDAQIRLKRSSSFYQGDKPQRKPGPGFSFLGYKEYEQGDDLRFLEVHKLCSNSKWLIRQFEVTSHDSMLILLDNSSSMYLGSQGYALDKMFIGINIACTLTLLGTQAGIDGQFGIIGGIESKKTEKEIVWSKTIRREVDYFKSLKPFINTQIMSLEREQCLGRKAYAQAMVKELPKRFSSKHLFILSDFWYPWKDELANILLQLTYRFRNVHLLQIIAEDEIEPMRQLEPKPFTLIDSENPDTQIVVHSSDMEAYYKKAKTHCEQLKHFALNHGIFYNLVKVPLISAEETIQDLQQMQVMKTLAQINITY